VLLSDHVERKLCMSEAALSSNYYKQIFYTWLPDSVVTQFFSESCFPQDEKMKMPVYSEKLMHRRITFGAVGLILIEYKCIELFV
jgi:hypothetical protein